MVHASDKYPMYIKRSDINQKYRYFRNYHDP